MDVSNSPLVRHKEGDYVVIDLGDSLSKGCVVSVFAKLSGAIRYVIENDDGVLTIHKEQEFHAGHTK